MDYLDNVTGQFDRVVSVGMMEHVGIGHLDEHSAKDPRATKPDQDKLFTHCIGPMSQPGTTGPFIRIKYYPKSAQRIQFPLCGGLDQNVGYRLKTNALEAAAEVRWAPLWPTPPARRLS